MGVSNPLRKTAVGLVQGGEATFTFAEAPPLGRVWTGGLTVGTMQTSVPGSAVFFVTIGGQAWGSFNGGQSFGPVQALKQEQIVISSFGMTGLPGGTQVVCTLVGSDDQEGDVPYLWPQPNQMNQTVSPIGATTYADLDGAFKTYADIDLAFSTYHDIAGFRAVS